MVTAKSLLNKRFNKAFENLAQNQSDLLEQNRASSIKSMGGMEGGFGNDAELAINRELGQDRKDLTEQQQTETEILNLQEKTAKEQADKAKKAQVVSTVGGILTTAASIVNPALGAGVGIAAQAANGIYGGTADFSNIDYSALGEMGGYFKRKKKFNNSETFGVDMAPEVSVA